MQTFLPYADFYESAKVLDNKRLGKQRVENLQILKALMLPKYGWQNHPAVRMWRSHEAVLLSYHHEICAEWLRRGYADTTLDKALTFARQHTFGKEKPSWLGDERVHKTHRSNLMQKDYSFYSRYGWTEPLNYCYFWPV